MTITGEYWIEDGDKVTECDGDKGHDVPNHEVVVIRHAIRMLVDAVSELPTNSPAYRLFDAVRLFDEPEVVPDVIAIWESLLVTSDSMAQGGNMTEEQADDLFGWLSEVSGVDSDVVDIATSGFDTNQDIRQFAVTNWGWIRVYGNNLDIPRVSKRTCRNLEQGLTEICDEEQAGEFEKMEWSVHDIGRNYYKMGVPGSLLTDPSTLRQQLLPVAAA